MMPVFPLFALFTFGEIVLEIFLDFGFGFLFVTSYFFFGTSGPIMLGHFCPGLGVVGVTPVDFLFGDFALGLFLLGVVGCINNGKSRVVIGIFVFLNMYN